VRLTVGQILEIPFRGTGWVYLGELGNRRGVSYDSRRLDVENRITIGQSFIFRAEIPGTYILKFYKQDFIQDYIINDYVQVIVGETDDSGTGRAFSNIDRGRVVAEPRWPFVPEAAGSASETTSLPAMPQAPQAAGAAAETTSQRPNEAVTQADTAEQSFAPAAASPAAESVLSPEEYVRQAKQEFDAGRVEQALAVLEQMKQRYPYGTDEAWWLLGQLYEANSPARDIRLSLEYYRRLVNEYPQSDRVADARRRIAYLERYYLNIR
jgi:tetratricopeptide (TPR) repeat protein